MLLCSEQDYTFCNANCGECPKGGQSCDELQQEFVNRYNLDTKPTF
jgi:hypothetical protein